MKLLMITRKVDRSEHLAGFIYNWIKKLSPLVDQLVVIAWQGGDPTGLPENVKVIQLKAKQNKLLKLVSFKVAVWKNIRNVDGIFCHQMPIYTIIVAPMAKLYRKKLVAWYAHGTVSWPVRLVEKLADVILTSSPQGFRLKSNKIKVIGQGIDVSTFYPAAEKPSTPTFSLISVGRISPSKDYESMIKAVVDLKTQGQTDVELTIIGEAGLANQNKYFDSLRMMVQKTGVISSVHFAGSKPNSEIPELLRRSDVFISMSNTGSLDKAVLEAMACGCLVLTSNEAFAEVLPKDLIVERDQPSHLAEKIKWLKNLPTDQVQQLREQLINIVKQNHNLENLVRKIVEQF